MATATSHTSHSRDLSTVSSVTLHPNSPPYQPLLSPISPSPSSNLDAISYRLRSPQWSQNNLRTRHRKINDAISTPQSRPKQFQWLKTGLESIMVVWSLYTMIRYLYAFTLYEGLNGQLATLGLAICAGISFALMCCSIILTAVIKYMLTRGVFIKSLSTIQSILQYPPPIFFLVPAMTNFILLFVWKNNSADDLNFRDRCKLDVDLLWTVTPSQCENLGRPWGIWIAFAVIRIILSLLVIIAFHNISSSQVIFIPNLTNVKSTKHQKSLSAKYIESKVSSTKFTSMPSFTRRSLRHRATENSTSSSRYRLRSTKSRSSDNIDNLDFVPAVNPPQNHSTFMERFRRLVSLITQETDDAVAYARSSVVSGCSSQESAVSPTLHESCQGLDKEPHSPEYGHIPAYDDLEDDFFGSPSREGQLDDDHTQVYPLDEHVRMLNGYINRMPTIESMGSRELIGSVGTGNTNHERKGPRLSTMSARRSWSGTEISSSDPRKSLTAQAELLYGASEVGELVKQGMSIKVEASSGSIAFAAQDNDEEPPDYYSSGSGSKNSTSSFHTAQ